MGAQNENCVMVTDGRPQLQRQYKKISGHIVSALYGNDMAGCFYSFVFRLIYSVLYLEYTIF